MKWWRRNIFTLFSFFVRGESTSENIFSLFFFFLALLCKAFLFPVLVAHRTSQTATRNESFTQKEKKKKERRGSNQANRVKALFPFQSDTSISFSCLCVSFSKAAKCGMRHSFAPRSLVNRPSSRSSRATSSFAHAPVAEVSPHHRLVVVATVYDADGGLATSSS